MTCTETMKTATKRCVRYHKEHRESSFALTFSMRSKSDIPASGYCIDSTADNSGHFRPSGLFPIGCIRANEILRSVKCVLETFLTNSVHCFTTVTVHEPPSVKSHRPECEKSYRRGDKRQRSTDTLAPVHVNCR